MPLLVTAMDKNNARPNTWGARQALKGHWHSQPPAQDPIYPGHVPEWACPRLSSLYVWTSLSECLSRCLQGPAILGTW